MISPDQLAQRLQEECPMEIDATAPRRGDLTSSVKKLTLEASDGRSDEMRFLSELWKVWQGGGLINLTRPGEEKPYLGWRAGQP